MRAVIQRVSEASVRVEGETVGEIGPGLVVLVGVGQSDEEEDALLLAKKIVGMRIFPDAAGRFNCSVLESEAAVLVVSQFTLYADTRRGRRPSFSGAAMPGQAASFIELFVAEFQRQGVAVATGVFGAHMQVALVNDGPVTIMLDTATLRESRRGR